MTKFILLLSFFIVYSLQKKIAGFQYKNISPIAKITQFRMSFILAICLSIFTQCELTKDADCKKQKDDEQKCLRAFTLFCSGNSTMAECDGRINSIIFIGTVCKYDTPCKSNTDDVVSDKIQTGNTK